MAQPARKCALALALVIAAAAGDAAAAAQPASARDPRRWLPLDTTLGVGFDYNRGDYGSGTTSETGSLTPSLKLEWQTIIVRAALPFYGLHGPSGDGLRAANTTEYGVGDLLTSVSYTLFPTRRDLPFLEFTGKLKFPTANSDFGTGKVDLTLVLEMARAFDALFAFADFGYRFRGGGLYHDSLLAAAGAGVPLPGRASLWLVYDWRESPFAGRGDEHDLTPFVSIPLGPHLRFDPYAVIGLAQASPDWGLGSTVSWKF